MFLQFCHIFIRYIPDQTLNRRIQLHLFSAHKRIKQIILRTQSFKQFLQNKSSLFLCSIFNSRQRRRCTDSVADLFLCIPFSQSGFSQKITNNIYCHIVFHPFLFFVLDTYNIASFQLNFNFLLIILSI